MQVVPANNRRGRRPAGSQAPALLAVLFVVFLTLAACGDGADDDDDYVGTIPVFNSLEWSPAGSLGPTEQELVGMLDELGMSIIVPTTPPPDGATVGAYFLSHGEAYPGGTTLAGHTTILLTVGENLITVSSPPAESDCYQDGSTTLILRGDSEARASGEHQVCWGESGQQFGAVFGEGLTLAQGLAWLETWRLLP